MPATPKPGDPTYDNLKKEADKQGITVHEYYQSMINKSASAEGAVGAYEGPATPKPTGTYKGEKYDPGGSAWNIPAALAWGGEVTAEADIKKNAKILQDRMDKAYEGLAGARHDDEKIYWTGQIQDIRDEYDGLMDHVQTGASGYHAAQRMFATGQPTSQLGAIKDQVQTGFNVDLAYQLREPANRVADRVGTYATKAGAEQQQLGSPSFQPGLGYESPLATQQPQGGQQTGSAMAAWKGIPGEPYPAAQAISPRGGYSYTPPGMPMGGLADPYRGDAGGGLGAGTNYLEPYEGPDAAGGIPGIPTPGFRGFRTYADLQAGLPEGDPGTVFSANEMRAAYDYQVSAPRALRDVMDRAPTVDYFRGGEKQRVDLGQGIQDYDVRRDAYGNIRSYTPSKNLSAEDAMKIGR